MGLWLDSQFFLERKTKHLIRKNSANIYDWDFHKQILHIQHKVIKEIKIISMPQIPIRIL